MENGNVLFFDSLSGSALISQMHYSILKNNKDEQSPFFWYPNGSRPRKRISACGIHPRGEESEVAVSAPDRPIRVLIVKDSQDEVQAILEHLRRHGFTSRHRVVDSGSTFAAALVELKWDVVLSDYSPSHIDGLRAADLQLAKAAGIPFIFVSGRMGAGRVAEVMRRGASGHVLQDRLTQLVPVIERELRTRDGRKRLGDTEAPSGSESSKNIGLHAEPSAAGVLRRVSFQPDVPPGVLSARQREVLLLVAEGCTSKEIAQSLLVSAKTAEAHRAQLMEKLGIHSAVGLVRYAVRHGLIDP
jgi:DNA-binding NarL/FixJ family response regulator